MKNIATPAIAVTAALVVAGCTSLTPTEDPVQLRLTDFEARLIRIEKQLDSESLITLSTRVDQLRADVAALRGQIEEVQFDVEGNAQRQRDLYLDLDSRLQALEQSRGQAGLPPAVGGGVNAAPSFGGPSAVPPTVSQPPGGGSGQFGDAAAGGNVGAPASRPEVGAQTPAAFPPSGPALSGTDQDNYNRAYDLLDRKDYAGANRAFTEFLAAFPTSPLAPNAQYWLGETFYVRDMFEEALPAFQKVIDDYPASLKEPDAMLKLGYVHDALGNKEAARATLQQVMQRYPNTTYARLASVRLSQVQ